MTCKPSISLHPYLQEEDFLKIIEESTQIEKVYKSYFDTTIVNDSFDDTFREIRKIVDSLSSDTQWVPVNWVYWASSTLVGIVFCVEQTF